MCPPFDLLLTDPVIRFYSCCFKREYQLEAWLYNLVLCFPIRAACSFTLVFWDEDPNAMQWLEDLKGTCGPLIVANYVSLHHAKGMPYWNASLAKNTAALCASMLTEAGSVNRKSFMVNLDCDNVVDLQGIRSLLKHLRDRERYPETYDYHIVRWKGADAGVTGRIGCFKDHFFMINGYNPVSYTHLTLPTNKAV